ncbi:MAG: hypothetical protein AVDCRST_MAG08-1043, partial [uncultured Acetobacteraceae bacterium]
WWPGGWATRPTPRSRWAPPSWARPLAPKRDGWAWPKTIGGRRPAPRRRRWRGGPHRPAAGARRRCSTSGASKGRRS